MTGPQEIGADGCRSGRSRLTLATYGRRAKLAGFAHERAKRASVQTCWRSCCTMLSWILPALTSMVQLGIFFAAAAALVAGMLGVR